MTTTTETITTAFNVGDNVATRSFCDYDCIFRFTVVARSKCFVTFADDHGDTYRVKPWVTNGVEYATPFGKHSMSALLTAGKNID